MKTHEIKNLLIVEVPKDAKGILCFTIGTQINIGFELNGRFISSYLGHVDYDIHSYSSTITEDQAKEIVDKNQYGHAGWRNYTESKMMFWEKSAMDSYNTLLSSLGITRAVNLIKK